MQGGYGVAIIFARHDHSKSCLLQSYVKSSGTSEQAEAFELIRLHGIIVPNSLAHAVSILHIFLLPKSSPEKDPSRLSS
jgi:hypothetical protein